MSAKRSGSFQLASWVALAAGLGAVFGFVTWQLLRPPVKLPEVVHAAAPTLSPAPTPVAVPAVATPTTAMASTPKAAPAPAAAAAVDVKPPAPPLASSVPAAADALADVIVSVEPALVGVEVQTPDGVRRGTGFVATPDGRIVTSAPLLQGALSATVIYPLRPKCEVSAVALGPAGLHLAILTTTAAGNDFDYLSLASVAGRSGDVVYTASFRPGDAPAVGDGKVAAIMTGQQLMDRKPALRVPGPLEAAAHWLAIDAAATGEGLGSLLLNARGEVLGLRAWSTSGEGCFELDARHIRPLLVADRASFHPLIAAAPRPPVPHVPPAPVALAAPVAPAPPAAVGPTDSRLEQAIRQREARFKKLAEHRQTMRVQQKTNAEKLTAAQQQQVATQTEFQQLTVNAERVQLQIDQLQVDIEAAALDDQGRDRTEFINNRRFEQRRLLAEYNMLDAAAAKARIRNQDAIKQQTEAAREFEQTARQVEPLLKEWVAGIDLLRTLSTAEHASLLAMFSEMVTDDSENAGAILGRGIAAWKLGRTADALSDFQRTVELDQGFAASAMAAKARIEFTADHATEGRGDFARAFKLANRDPWLLLLRGMALAAEKKYPLAERDFKSANQLSTSGPEAFRLLGLLYAQWPGSTTHAKKALESAERACELSSNADWACLDALATVHAAAGNFDQAAEIAGKAAELALDDNRQKCLAHQQRYAAHEPPEFDWR